MYKKFIEKQKERQITEFSNIKKFFDSRLFEVEKRLKREIDLLKQGEQRVRESRALCHQYKAEIKEFGRGWEVLKNHGWKIKKELTINDVYEGKTND